MTRLRSIFLIVSIIASGTAVPVSAQQTSQGASNVPQPQEVTRGVVVSSTRNTLVVQVDGGEYRLFQLTAQTARPPRIPAGATVGVTSRTGEYDGAPLATVVTVTAPPPPPPAAGAAPVAASTEPVPTAVRDLERAISRESRRFRIGARTGVALDPELVLIGAHTQLGPFFNENVWARPNIEIGFGEVTTEIALNFEGIYRVPVTARGSRWSSFFGVGFGFNFVNQSFSTPEDEDGDRFDFSDFSLDTGFNLIAGVQSRSGLVMELKATAYSIPHLRFIVGYNF